MRRRTLTMLIAVGLMALLAPNRASAQVLPPVYGQGYGNYGRAGPALSPYLNLTRGGNPAANYFLGVLPEIDRRRTQAIQGREITDLGLRTDVLAQQQALLESSIAPELTGGGLPPSGHPATFTTYGSYFGLTAPASPAARLQSAQVRRR
jgi:hypothetical protein